MYLDLYLYLDSDSDLVADPNPNANPFLDATSPQCLRVPLALQSGSLGLASDPLGLASASLLSVQERVWVWVCVWD